MKKLISLMLALIMVFSLATVASAAESETTTTIDTTGWKSDATTLKTTYKTYTVTGNTTTDIYPTETLSFTSQQDSANPDTTNLTIDNLVVAGAENQTLTINVPSYSKVGTYKYTISETDGSAQGVTYTDETLSIVVLVTYDYTNSKLAAQVGVTMPEGEGAAKNMDLTNEYDLGSLAVTKEVTGNLGDKSKEFTVKVTFNAESGKTVESAISYTDGTENKTIAADWTGSKEVDITLKHGETVTFTDIPAGVTYTVVENDYTSGEKNGENGYDEAQYDFSDNNKAIAKSDADTVKITNNKSQLVATGIVTDSAPYIILIAVCAVAAVAFVLKRRNAVEF